MSSNMRFSLVLAFSIAVLSLLGSAPGKAQSSLLAQEPQRRIGSVSLHKSPDSGLNFEAASRYSASKRGVSMFVLKDGRLIYEEYYNGGSPDRAHELYSGTKSFIGVAAVLAQEDGLLRLDDKVSETITEWQGDPVRKEITIRQLLHLTAGLQGGPGRAPTYEEAIYQEIKGKPGERFKYGPASFQVFGELLYRKLGEKETIEDYLQRKVFKPLGMQVAGWKVGADGMPIVSQGLQLTASNWAKFGELILREGQHDQKQILSRTGLKECFVGTKANPMYGLTWWLNKPIEAELRKTITPLTASTDIEYGVNEIPKDLVMAAGAAGQRLYVIPSQNMVIVRQAKGLFSSLLSKQNGKFSDMQFLTRLFTGKPSQVQFSGNTSQNEASQNRRQRLKRFFARFDRDGNGSLDQSEKSELIRVMQRWRRFSN